MAPNAPSHSRQSKAVVGILEGRSVYPNWDRPFGVGSRLQERQRASYSHRRLLRTHGATVRTTSGSEEAGPMMLSRYAITICYIAIISTLCLVLQVWQWTHA